MGGSQSTPFSKQLENYKITGKNQENNMTYLSHKETEKEYLLRQLTFNDENIYAKSLQNHKKRLSLSPNNLTNLIRVEGREIDHLCSNIYKVYAIWEYPFRFLSEQISQRAVQNRKFQPIQLQSIMVGCILGMSTLQQNKIRHQSLTTKSILLDNEGIVKVCDPLATSSLTNFDRIYNNRTVPDNFQIQQSVYLSPEQCQSLDNRNSYSNSYKNDIYAMGLILLQCGLLKQQYSVYKNNFDKINPIELQKSLNIFTQHYGKELRNLLQLMLKNDETDRPDWISLKQFTNKQSSQNKYVQQTNSYNTQFVKPPPIISQQQPTPHYQHSTQNTFIMNNNPNNINSTHHYQQNANIQNTNFQNFQNLNSQTNVQPSRQFYRPQPTTSANNYMSNIQTSPLKNLQSYQNNQHQSYVNTYTNPPTTHYYSNLNQGSVKKGQIDNYNYQSSKNDNLFTDPKLLMMVRGQNYKPMNSYDYTNSALPKEPSHYVPPTTSVITSQAPTVYKSSMQNYQTGYLFSQPTKTLQSQAFTNSRKQQNSRRQQSLQSKQNPIAKIKEQIQASNQAHKQSQSKPTIESNNQHILNHKNQHNIQNTNQNQNNQNYQYDQGQNEGGMELVIETFKQGSRYEGYKLNDMRHGKGKFFYLDGGLYDGDWKYNKMDGQGSLYYQSGKLAYEGGWQDDKFQGYGVLYNEYPVDLRQQGGQGFDFTDFDGIDDYWEKYQGQFEQDFKKGHGKLVLGNGQWFEGTFDDDMVQGQGQFHCFDGRVIRGNWKANQFIQ